MNRTTNKLRAEFEPETRFELRPTPAAPFRATQETEFERLKNRLVTEALLATARAELNPAIRRAANEAAALAWVTYYPLLVFPTLFEEKTRNAVRQAARQAHIYANSPELVVAG
ncbi:MAG: hypothetical protein P4M10_06055 [Verrucomicrobiae bacterium]|nr:hypothetical protein [Verrucomicrobiae bacterium]